MFFWKKMYTDYKDSRSTPYEGFLEWFLKRKLGFWGKIAFAYTLWGVWLFLFSRPYLYIWLFYLVVFLSLVMALVEWYHYKKDKWR